MSTTTRQRVTCTPAEAAALDRLLDAYLASEERAVGDPGFADLANLRRRVRRLRHDHSRYDDTPEETR